MMNSYEIRVIPKVDASGKTYWTAFYPAIDGCVGGGDTPEEAIKEAEENLEFFLAYLQDEKIEIPKPYAEPRYSGKIALRISKSTHKLAAERANEEGISINTLLVSAIENYLGKKEYEFRLNEKIEQIQDISRSSLQLQGINFEFNMACAQKWMPSEKRIVVGGIDE